MKLLLISALAVAVAGCDIRMHKDVTHAAGDSRVEVIDGDTFRSWNGQSWRLARIDAPEFDGHCRQGRKCVEGNPMVAKMVLDRLTHGKPVKCKLVETDVYNRNIGECEVNGQNLSDRLLQLGVVEEYRR